ARGGAVGSPTRLCPAFRSSTGLSGIIRMGKRVALPCRMRDGWSIGAGMGRVVGFLHPLGRQVRINLGRTEALVTQQLLDASQVRTIVQQVRGEAVTQRMRADTRIQASRDEILVELAAHRAGA